MAENTLILDEEEYDIDELTEQQQYLCKHIRDLRQRQDSLRFQMDQLAVGLKGFVDKLKESMD
jgi:FtsZ-binding cell division protein ZapB